MVFNKGDADSSQQNNQSDEESRMRVGEKGKKGGTTTRNALRINRQRVTNISELE